MRQVNQKAGPDWFVPQTPVLLADRVENIRYGKADATDEIAHAAG